MARSKRANVRLSTNYSTIALTLVSPLQSSFGCCGDVYCPRQPLYSDLSLIRHVKALKFTSVFTDMLNVIEQSLGIS